MSSLAPQTKISFMIGKYDKDFLSPDPPVPTPLKTHLGPGAPGLRSMRGHLGPAGGEKAQNCGDTPPGHKSEVRSGEMKLNSVVLVFVLLDRPRQTVQHAKWLEPPSRASIGILRPQCNLAKVNRK